MEQRKKKNMFRKPVVFKNQKQQQQPSVDPITGKKIPKSFVFARGKLPGPLRQLQMDLRKLMLPYTALNLRVNIPILFHTFLISIHILLCMLFALIKQTTKRVKYSFNYELTDLFACLV